MFTAMSSADGSPGLVYLPWSTLRSNKDRPNDCLCVTLSDHGGNCSVRGSSWGSGPGMDAVEEISYPTAHLETPRTLHNPAVW